MTVRDTLEIADPRSSYYITLRSRDHNGNLCSLPFVLLIITDGKELVLCAINCVFAFLSSYHSPTILLIFRTESSNAFRRRSNQKMKNQLCRIFNASSNFILKNINLIVSFDGENRL